MRERLLLAVAWKMGGKANDMSNVKLRPPSCFCLIIIFIFVVASIQTLNFERTVKREKIWNEFVAAATEQIDLKELQKWASVILEKYSAGDQVHEEAPYSVLKFEHYSPVYSIIISDASRHEQAIDIWWRKSYGGKGIVVGAPTSHLNNSEFFEATSFHSVVATGVVFYVEFGE